MNSNLRLINKPGLVYEYFTYYQLEIRFRRPMLATTPAPNILKKHIIDTAKKEMEKVRKITGKIGKHLAKYENADIPEQKEIAELKGTIYSYMALTGIEHVLPDDIKELLVVAAEVEKEFDEKVKAGVATRATVFMTDKDGKIQISPHMVLGFVKSVTSTVVNSTSKEKKAALKGAAEKPKKAKAAEVEGTEATEVDCNSTVAITTKTGVSEIFALDLKWVEAFVTPDKDKLWLPDGDNVISMNNTDEESIDRICAIIEDRVLKAGEKKGEMVPALLERPLLTDKQGVKTATIAQSQILPAGATIKLHLRIRSESPVNTEKKLMETFIYGKNQGLGQWRGSGGFGSFDFRLYEIIDPRQVETIAGEEDGWM